MMGDNTLYIPALSDDYTGFSTFVTAGTSTGNIRHFCLEQDMVKKFQLPREEEQDEVADKLGFYEKKVR